MPDNFDTAAALTSVQTFLASVGLTAVTGVPESFAGGVSAYAALGPREMRDIGTNDFIEISQGVFIGVGYRVKGAEATIEAALATKLDEITRRFILDRRNSSGMFAVCKNVILDQTLSRDPRYQLLAGQEFRLYPFMVTFTQREVIT